MLAFIAAAVVHQANFDKLAAARAQAIATIVASRSRNERPRQIYFPIGQSTPAYIVDQTKHLTKYQVTPQSVTAQYSVQMDRLPMGQMQKPEGTGSLTRFLHWSGFVVKDASALKDIAPTRYYADYELDISKNQILGGYVISKFGMSTEWMGDSKQLSEVGPVRVSAFERYVLSAPHTEDIERLRYVLQALRFQRKDPASKTETDVYFPKVNDQTFYVVDLQPTVITAFTVIAGHARVDWMTKFANKGPAPDNVKDALAYFLLKTYGHSVGGQVERLKSSSGYVGFLSTWQPGWPVIVRALDGHDKPRSPGFIDVNPDLGLPLPSSVGS